MSTVMFCDLVDSTGIAARLDAEEWRDLVGAYLDAASAAVTEMGSKVAKKLGDGLMALFGYPVAQENDADRGWRECRWHSSNPSCRHNDTLERYAGDAEMGIQMNNGSQPVGDYRVCTMLLGSSALCCFSSANPVEHKALVTSLSDFGAFLAITANPLRAEVRQELSRFT